MEPTSILFDAINVLYGPNGESDWDPRVLLTLETRMEHGKHTRAAEAAEVPRRVA
jgi:hypothetical protein